MKISDSRRYLREVIAEPADSVTLNDRKKIARHGTN
jgi:hypothetical protein